MMKISTIRICRFGRILNVSHRSRLSADSRILDPFPRLLALVRQKVHLTRSFICRHYNMVLCSVSFETTSPENSILTVFFCGSLLSNTWSVELYVLILTLLRRWSPPLNLSSSKLVIRRCRQFGLVALNWEPLLLLRSTVYI